MARKKKEDTPDVTVGDISESVSSILKNNLNAKFKSTSGKFAYNLDEEGVPSIVTGWIPSGCMELDLAMSNRPNGGFPIGRLTEIFGPPSSGKSLLALHALANTQKLGGTAVLIDTESSASPDFFKSIGINTKELLWIQPDSLEDIFEGMDAIIQSFKSQKAKGPLTIVVDSVTNCLTRKEVAGGYEKQGYGSEKAILLSLFVKKIANMISREKVCLIFINQVRDNVNASIYEDKEIVPGGKAVPFYASIRLRCKQTSKLTDKSSGVEIIIGSGVRTEIKKNKVAPGQGRKVEYDVYFDSGVYDPSSWLNVATNYGIFNIGGGGWGSYIDDSTGEVIKFQGADGFVDKIYNNPDVRESLYKKICDKYIIPYDLSKDPNNITRESTDDES